jgi:hypothetical protein
MIKSLFSAFFSKCEVHAKQVSIRGMYSAGMQDRPGVWFKQ